MRPREGLPALEGPRAVGLAQLIAEANGLDRVGRIKENISERMIDATLVRAALEAAIENGSITSDGHAIRDLTADALGGWQAVTNIQAGGGLYAQRVVSRMHYDLEGAKRLALARADLADLRD